MIGALSGVLGASVGGSLFGWLGAPLGSLLGRSLGGSLGVSLAGPMGGAQGVLLSGSFVEQFSSSEGRQGALSKQGACRKLPRFGVGEVRHQGVIWGYRVEGDWRNRF